jgi:thiol-disulfide isomerase/thioredoxin
VEDFLAANERAREGKRLLVVKFYSDRCRACKFIAPKYSRLVKDLKDSDAADFYEVEVRSSMELAKRLGVEMLPTVQIFDGDDVTRLGSYPCAPAAWKKAEKKLRFVPKYLLERHGWMKRIGEPLKDELSI